MEWLGRAEKQPLPQNLWLEEVENKSLPSISFDLAVELDWGSAVFAEDIRRDYGERRFCVLAMLGERLHAIVITPRTDAIQVISFRKANKREVDKYAKIREKT